MISRNPARRMPTEDILRLPRVQRIRDQRGESWTEQTSFCDDGDQMDAVEEDPDDLFLMGGHG